MEPVLTTPELDLNLEQVNDLTEEISRYHAIFSPLFFRREQRERAQDYLQGLVSPRLARKSVEPMSLALHGGSMAAVRALQTFISAGAWDDEAILHRHWHETDALIGEDDGVLTLDGSDFPKQGKYSVGVKRQYCGELGKRANCQAGVFLGYSSSKGYTLLDRRLYLPREWVEAEDHAERRRRCRVPETTTFKTQPKLGLEMIQAQVAAGVLRARYVVCDEGFGRIPALLDEVAALGLYYLAEVPKTTRLWTERPQTEMPAYTGTGRRPVRQRLAETAAAPEEARRLAQTLPEAAWSRHVVKEGSKGPIVATFARLRVVAVRGGLPGPGLWLVLRRNPDTDELKIYLSNAPLETSLSELVRVCGMRWPIERAFRDGKQMLGMGDYEVRTWRGWHHHMTMVILAHGFLVRLQRRLKKGGTYRTT